MHPSRYRMTAAAAVVGALLTTGPQPSHALDVDPGDYAAAPPGTNLLLAYGLFGWNNSFKTRTGDSVPGSHVDSQIGILRAVHYFDVGITIDPQIFLVGGSLNDGQLGGEHLNSATGFGDIILASTAWLVNEPENKRWFGITPFLYLPTGNYRNKQVLNIGENRYKGVLQAGFVQGIDDWTIDLIADTTFYGNNDRAGADGQSTLRQDNSYQTQAWLRYNITPEWAVGPGYSGVYGGTTYISGDKNGGATQQQQLRLITQYWPVPDLQMQATLRTDVYAQGQFRETVGLNLRVMKVF